MRVKIHVDIDAVKPVVPGNHCITVCAMDGTILERGRKLKVKGEWILRQYNNQVPCGASVVLYPEGEESSYTMLL